VQERGVNQVKKSNVEEEIKFPVGEMVARTWVLKGKVHEERCMRKGI
jgi:hypothetical protein